MPTLRTATGPASPRNVQAILHGAAYSVAGALLLPLFVAAAAVAARVFGIIALAVIPMAALGAFVGKGISVGLGRDGDPEVRYCAIGFALAALAGMVAAREAGSLPGLAALAITSGTVVGWLFAETTGPRIAIAGCAAIACALIVWLAPPALSLAVPSG